MQKIATRIFIYASIVFGVVGILMVLTTDPNTQPNTVIMKSLFTTVFIILPSFALSVAGKYLNGRS